MKISKVGFILAAIAIPEACRFVAAYSSTTKSDELFENYSGLNPIGTCVYFHRELKERNEFKANVSEVLYFIGLVALGIATPVSCYFAMTKPKSITTIAPAILLCAVQSGLTYNWSRE